MYGEWDATGCRCLFHQFNEFQVIALVLWNLPNLWEKPVLNTLETCVHQLVILSSHSPTLQNSFLFKASQQPGHTNHHLTNPSPHIITQYPKPRRVLELDSWIGEINELGIRMISMDRMDEERAKRQLEVTTLYGISESGFFNLTFSDHRALNVRSITFSHRCMLFLLPLETKDGGRNRKRLGVNGRTNKLQGRG